VKVSLIRRTVAEKSDRSATPPADCKRSPSCRSNAASNNSETANQPFLNVYHVHRTCSAAACSSGTAEHLGHEGAGIRS
jgi:hypothetical protein